MVAAMAVAGCGGTQPSPQFQPSQPACSTGQLATTLGQTGAGMAQRYVTVIFQNTGHTACYLDGYPSVVAQGSADVGSLAAKRSTGIGPPTDVTLAPGGAASALVQTVDVQMNGLTCVTYQTLQVRPPGSRRSTTLMLSGTGLEGPQGSGLYSCGPIFVGPVQAGVIH